MSDYISGGKNEIHVFGFLNTSTPGAVQDDGTTPATTAAHKVFNFDLTEEVTFAEDMSPDLNQIKDDTTLEKFKRVWAPRPSAQEAGLPEKIMTNGLKVGGTTANSKDTLNVFYEGETTDEDDDPVLKVTVVIGNWAMKGWKIKANDYSAPGVGLKAAPAKAEYVVPPGLIDAALLPGTGTTILDYANGTTGEVLTIPADQPGRTFFLKKTT